MKEFTETRHEKSRLKKLNRKSKMRDLDRETERGGRKKESNNLWGKNWFIFKCVTNPSRYEAHKDFHIIFGILKYKLNSFLVNWSEEQQNVTKLLLQFFVFLLLLDTFNTEFFIFGRLERRVTKHNKITLKLF